MGQQLTYSQLLCVPPYFCLRKELKMPVQNRYSQFLPDQRQFFDELITEDWDTYQSEAWDYTRTFEVRQLFKRVQSVHILDVGCGCGFHDTVMAEYPFVEREDGIDYSEQSILRANAEYPHPKVHRRVADFTAFHPQRIYDLVVSFQVIEHLTNPDEYLAFCANVCKPQGVVAVWTPNRVRWVNRIRAIKRKPLELIDPMHFREYTAHEIFEMGKKFGLKPFGLFGHTFQMRCKLDFKKQTKLGKFFPHFANTLGVMMIKN